MTDQTERLRRMTDYSWHVLRADSEHERAMLAHDANVSRRHDELAELHLLAADDLSDSWRDFSARGHKGGDDESWRAYEALFTSLYGAENLEKMKSLIPAALKRLT